MAERITDDGATIASQPATHVFPGYPFAGGDHGAPGAPGGDAVAVADVASVAAMFAEPARRRIVLVLLDGRALPASRVASEAGVAPSTASGHLAVLLNGGAVTVEQHGRHRYYRLAGPDVAAAAEQLTTPAGAVPVRSLRDGTRAAALRRGRTCYDHLAGRLGVELLRSLLANGWLRGHDGSFRAGVDHLSSRGVEAPYELTALGERGLADLGVTVADGNRPFLAYCVDWTEQRHHLAGRLGAALATRLFERGWIERGTFGRTAVLTDAGRVGLRERFGFHLS
jgi:DNA-binding transcriptional ArsR family regulator